MNHPRRLLLLVPLALLGATLLVRARLPRPQTKGDKWLWEQAEKVPALDIDFQEDTTEALRKIGFKGDNRHLVITDRKGIRNVLRSFEGTPAFDSHSPNVANGAPIIIGLDKSGSFKRTIQVYDQERARDSKCYVGRSNPLPPAWGRSEWETVPTNTRSIVRFNQALCEAVVKARHKQLGYSVYTGGE